MTRHCTLCGQPLPERPPFIGANPAFVAPLRYAIEPVPVSTKGFNRGEGCGL